LKLRNSPLSKKLLRKGFRKYQDIGLYWSNLVLLTSCFVASDKRWLFIKTASSGSGKTITDKIAIESFGERLRPLCVSGRLTPAGLVKLMKRAEKNKKAKIQLDNFKDTELIFVEDLSRCTTRYLKLTSLQFLAGLTRTISLDDLTSEGGTLGEVLGDKPKKAMISCTPSDWEEISSSSLYNEFIDRRSLTVVALMNNKEWKEREKRALNLSRVKPDWEIILEWKTLIKDIGVEPYFGPMLNRTVKTEDRTKLYTKLRAFKKYPENLLFMIDSLAEGHARINGRNKVLKEDYEFLNKLCSRFLVIGDVKKKELYLIEELVRSDSGELSIEDLTYRLRIRSRKEDLPSLSATQRTIYNYVSLSKYLKKDRASRKRYAWVKLTPYLEKLFKEWEKEVGEII